MAESLMRHSRMLLNPRYGRVGLLAYPYFFFLETFGVGVEIAGYVAFAATVFMGLAAPLYVAGFFMAAFAFGMVLSIAAVGLEELGFRRYPKISHLAHLFALAAAENFGYRQLISFWRLHGMISALRGVRTWGEQERRGFDDVSVPQPGPSGEVQGND
jgi:hypothetical protein